MKFLIINTPTGNGAALDSSPEALKQYSAKIQGLLDAGHIDRAWVLHAGGHAYVINASSSEELAYKLRVNALYHSSHTQIIPIMDAVDFLSTASKVSG